MDECYFKGHQARSRLESELKRRVWVTRSHWYFSSGKIPFLFGLTQGMRILAATSAKGQVSDAKSTSFVIFLLLFKMHINILTWLCLHH